MSKTMKNDNQALVPRLRFPEFRKDGGWEESRLDDFAIIVRGGSPRPIDEYVTNDTNGLNWLKIGDIDKESKFVTCTQEKVIPAALTKTRVVNPGDLILSNSMSFGRPYILEIQTCIHDGWIAVSKINKSLDRDYLYYLIMTPESQTYFSDNAAGSGVQNLNADIIKLLPVLYPYKKEQQKIADCLSSIDDLITAQAQKIESLKAHKKGLMQQLFPAEGETLPNLRFPEFQNAGEWVETQLRKIAKPVSDKAYSKDNNNILTLSGEHGLVLQCEYFGKKIAGDNVDRYIRICRNDFVYNDRTTKLSIYGSIKRLSDYESGIVSPIYKCFRFIEAENPVFWDWYFDSGSHDAQLHGLVNEGARAGRFNISIDNFLSTQVWFPDSSEQQKIADCLSSIDDLIAAHTQKLDALKVHKKGLMQQLFPALDEMQR